MHISLKKANIFVCAVVGTIILGATFYGLINQMIFLWGASAFTASIVEVNHEPVRKGKVIVQAYVPIIEVPGEAAQERHRVDTFNEEPIYRVGDTLNVICNQSISGRCICSGFWNLWGGALMGAALASGFYLPVVLHLIRRRRKV